MYFPQWVPLVKESVPNTRKGTIPGFLWELRLYLTIKCSLLKKWSIYFQKYNNQTQRKVCPKCLFTLTQSLNHSTTSLTTAHKYDTVLLNAHSMNFCLSLQLTQLTQLFSKPLTWRCFDSPPRPRGAVERYETLCVCDADFYRATCSTSFWQINTLCKSPTQKDKFCKMK